jgi:hypothetical protein
MHSEKAMDFEKQKIDSDFGLDSGSGMDLEVDVAVAVAAVVDSAEVAEYFLGDGQIYIDLWFFVSMHLHCCFSFFHGSMMSRSHGRGVYEPPNLHLPSRKNLQTGILKLWQPQGPISKYR